METGEESVWLSECVKGFPEVRSRRIAIAYARTPKNVLARVKGRVMVSREIQAEKLLLEGNAYVKIKRLPKEYVIRVNRDVAKITKKPLRKQVVQYLVIHELLHILNKDLVTLSKKYGRRKKTKIHTKGFDKQVLSRYNTVRSGNGMKPIEISLKRHLWLNRPTVSRPHISNLMEEYYRLSKLDWASIFRQGKYALPPILTQNLGENISAGVLVPDDMVLL